MYIYLIHVSLRLPPTTTTAAQLAAFTFVPSCSFFCLFCFSLVSPFLSPRSPYPTQPYPLLLLFLSSGAPSIRLSGAASGRLPATIFHRQPAKQLTAQPPPGNCFGCERNFKHRHTASLGPPKHCFPLSLSSLSPANLPTHISMSLSISFCLSLIFALSLFIFIYLFSPFLSLSTPISVLFCFPIAARLSLHTLTHTHSHALFSLYAFCPSLLFPSPFGFSYLHPSLLRPLIHSIPSSLLFHPLILPSLLLFTTHRGTRCGRESLMSRVGRREGKR